MAEETPNKGTSMTGIFDDSDDSDDEDMSPPSTQQQPPSQQSQGGTPSTSKDVALFGSDSEDSDDDEKMADSGAAPKESEQEPEANDGEEEEAAAAAASEEKKDGDASEEESDHEFQAEGITGRKAPASSTKAASSATGDGPPKRLTVPKMPFPTLGPKTTLHMAQLPKVVGIQSEAFHRNTYNGKLEDAEFNGRAAHSMIRWRYKVDANGDKVRDENGKLVKESNARIVKWSDGTFGLRVGDEVFDMDEFSYSLTAPRKKGGKAVPQQPSKNPNAPVSKDYLYLTQQIQSVSEDGEMKSAGTILECVAPLQSKFKPRPASLKSASHKNFVLKERSRVMKRSQIQEFNTFVDPEKQKAERIRNKDDLMKQERRSGGRRSTGGGAGRRRYGMHRNYMDMDEDDEHYDTVNIRSLKRRNRDDDGMDYGEDDVMSDEEDEWSKRKKRGFESGRKTSKQQQYLSEEDEDEDEENLVLDDEEDDDEEEMLQRKNASRGGGQKRKSAGMFDDDDDDDSD